MYEVWHKKWRKIDTIYNLPDFFLEFTQVRGIGNVYVPTLFIYIREGPSIVWVRLFLIIILRYWLPFCLVHLRMVCIPVEKLSLMGNSDLTSWLLWWGDTFDQLSIVVLPDHLKAAKSQMKQVLGICDIIIHAYTIKNGFSSSYPLIKTTSCKSFQWRNVKFVMIMNK